MNPTTQIPMDQWTPFFNDLSRQLEGSSATIEIIGRELGDQPLASEMPFAGISVDSKGSEAGEIVIGLGDAETGYDAHHIHEPRLVRAVETQPGAQADIEIESGDGLTTVVHLKRRSQLPPA